MKNTELVRNFAIGGICILAAALVFLGAESGGRALGSRLGMIGLVGIVALLAISFIATRKIEAEKAEKTIPAKKRP